MLAFVEQARYLRQDGRDVGQTLEMLAAALGNEFCASASSRAGTLAYNTSALAVFTFTGVRAGSQMMKGDKRCKLRSDKPSKVS